jgi:hypothetical protein
VAEIIADCDITAPDQDGWTMSYSVRRDDGQEVPVIASCSRTAAASVRSANATAFLADRGRAAALEHASWNALDADGALLRDTVTTYHVRAVPEGWRFLSYTIISDRALPRQCTAQKPPVSRRTSR